jgi:probable phosphoglycerate mutase
MVSEGLSKVRFSAFYTSPLVRSKETAGRIAAPHKITPKIEEGLIDINYGDWEGLSEDEVLKKDPALHEKWLKSPDEVVFPNGEGLSEVRERAFEAVSRLSKLHEDDVIALVSHRVPNKIILLAVLGMDNSKFWDIEQDTACVNLVRQRGGRFIISKINDTSPIRPISQTGEVDF